MIQSKPFDLLVKFPITVQAYILPRSNGDKNNLVYSSSTESITLETWHRVKIRRSGRDGIVQLDNSTVARGSAPGMLTELNLEQPLYLGFVPYVTFTFLLLLLVLLKYSQNVILIYFQTRHLSLEPILTN